MDVDGNAVNLKDEELNYIMNDILDTKFTSKGLRAIAFAYKDMNLKEFENLKNECNDFRDENDRASLE